ncbi:UDP-N-acetylmuramoyl-tripeptide--D-alanyl-D-alanine ligase [Streptococcus oricebi]|uniref:UDP-N-acetylmuramoyl-tripeptide--D-alanyl-D-alanine ligase n=1 Tax=Streptococcus oricebi TaxID=1547447 RepID=A0ABS5B1H8_9STRE|nr:UDP-N-acetylmuramoyl-tripeptide--D-alanyl-D-alanine ligase [Streptococcus oricebi]MBP2622679.1 UDP-N-acetylmuramoyl-tripeptide--D-alanyl-D-alanine ligase [Streptococcus oricebi]
MNLTIHEIALVLEAKNDFKHYEDLVLNKAEFDSRLIGPGDLFLPLKGERDGHDFIATAFENGAVLTLSEKPVAFPHLLVTDVLASLQKLASYYLEKTGVDVLAVTGSNGKTTTKDMLAQLLASRYRTYKTQGNYNNEIGLPYTILQMPERTEKLVLEMGQDHLGDIHLLSSLAKPKVGIVTLIGEAHLEFFGSRKEIAQGKMQIADGMKAGSLLLLPADKLVNDFLPDQLNLVRFGPGQDIYLTELQEEKESLSFRTNFLDQTISLPVTGKYNATNAMLASYVALEQGVSPEEIIQAFQDLVLTRNRTEWKKAAQGADLLSDVYNANPTAMRLILETFSSLPSNPQGRKLAVLADMKELGPDSKQMHGAMITSLNPDIIQEIFLYGQDMASLYSYAQEIYDKDKVHYFLKDETEDQFDDLLAALKASLKPTDQVLLKGSNSMNLAKIVQALEEEDSLEKT